MIYTKTAVLTPLLGEELQGKPRIQKVKTCVLERRMDYASFSRRSANRSFPEGSAELRCEHAVGGS